ncbi:MAG: V-type ATPase subunit [Candidatus Hydrogenedentes bacterium]|nr:V-type ATPase subunit [Candidatus Hydrogenedentota bacterium]
MADLEPNKLYYNSRVRGLKSHLLAREQFEDFLNHDLQHMIDVLLESEYRQEMAEALTRYSGADAVEDAVSRNLVATLQMLVRRAQGEFQNLVRMFLMRWDLSAVKSLLRARHHGLSAAEAAPYLMPGPTMTVPLLTSLANRDSMEEVIAGLTGWNAGIAKTLVKALETYREFNDPAVFEEALDREYFVGYARQLRESEDPDAQQLRYFLQLEIDRINLRYVFQRLQSDAAGDDLRQLLLPEGTLSVAMLIEMANAGDAASATAMLESTRYRDMVETLFALLQNNRFAPVERFFESVFLREFKQLAVSDVFGMGVVMDFVWRKYNEAVNLRLIARGLAGSLPAGRVREELAYV